MLLIKKMQGNKTDATDTVIGAGSVFEGRIRSDAGIRIEGRIDGDISCEGDVVIGVNGCANSNIEARNVMLAGTVTGNVKARELLTIATAGKLFGNVAAKSLVIEAGGTYQGACRMEREAPAAAASLPEAPDTPLDTGGASASDKPEPGYASAPAAVS